MIDLLEDEDGVPFPEAVQAAHRAAVAKAIRDVADGMELADGRGWMNVRRYLLGRADQIRGGSEAER